MSDGATSAELPPPTWSEAFPWLKGAASLAPQPWWNDVIETADQVVRQERLTSICDIAMETLTRWRISELFPGLALDIELRRLQLPKRAMNALDRQGYCYTGDLAGLTVDDILEWRQIGVASVEAIVHALADASTSEVVPTVVTPSSTATQPWLQPQELPGRPPEVATAIAEDLYQLAVWSAAIGVPDRSLLGPLGPLGEAGAPQEVIDARRRIEAFSADSVLGADQARRNVAMLFDEALRTFDPRASRILALRLFANAPCTLDHIGLEYGVTRERVRQIEGKARGEMLSLLNNGGPLELVAKTVRGLIDIIRPLDDLINLLPALGNVVEAVGQPAWRVLDRLDDTYEIEDGWCVAPSMAAVIAMTQTHLQERADRYGVVCLDDVDIVPGGHPERRQALTVAWLQHCGYVIDGDHVLTRTQSVSDYGAAILSVTGSPMGSQQIIDRFVIERSAASLRNAMSVDDRFERVDRDSWALAEWGLDAYSGVRSLIRERISRAGGRILLDDLIESLTSKYSVTASTVVAYASSPPFENRDGIVRMRSGALTARKPPERTRRLFRRAGSWAYRIKITKEHLRGSGTVAPMAIAAIAGLEYGQTVYLTSPLGPQTVSWKGTQPMFGTIRKFLKDDDIATDTEAFLVIGDDGTFTFEAMPEPTGDALADALGLIGVPVATLRENRAALCMAIGLSEDTPTASLIGAYRERGDGDIADLLTDARPALESHTMAPQSSSTDIDEIMDLL
ncbi:sigma factor-like helix-turn-helix DNA-binding protein [Actinocorallia sp. B10E7]|uniref:sigma factor-like helix-turn-helix DNA-binding protein n=1 Tax=Actinocorallia sp. B10E7 TaxID=3153558 RepID=UPI00325DC649